MCIVEFDVRLIDDFGDANDVAHFETAAEAVSYAKGLVPGSAGHGAYAAVVERHIARRPAHLFDDPDTYDTISTFGNPDALRAWGCDDSELPKA